MGLACPILGSPSVLLLTPSPRCCLWPQEPLPFPVPLSPGPIASPAACRLHAASPGLLPAQGQGLCQRRAAGEVGPGTAASRAWADAGLCWEPGIEAGRGRFSSSGALGPGWRRAVWAWDSGVPPTWLDPCLVSGRGSCGCCHKGPQAGRLKTEMYSSPVLEATGPKPRCHRAVFPLGTLAEGPSCLSQPGGPRAPGLWPPLWSAPSSHGLSSSVSCRASCPWA